MQKTSLLILFLAAILLIASANGLPLTRAQAQSQDVPVGNDRNDPPPTEEGLVTESAEAQAAAVGLVYQTVPVAAFSSDGGNPTGFYTVFGEGYFYGIAKSNACLMAPLHLPSGSVITSLEATLRDSNVSTVDPNYEWFDLKRTDLNTGATITIGTLESPRTVATNGIVRLKKAITTNNAVSERYSYSIFTCARPGINVYGAAIGYYSSSTFLPSISR